MQSLQPEDPQQIGRYQLLARLGSGGMGRVYLGRSPGGRLIAIKLIRPELADNADFRRRFAREVTAAKTVGGMYTATVVDADPEAAAPWLVTAYIDGSSLADVVATHGPLPADSVLQLAAALAEGLCAIHAAGLVHRDLKPTNVLLAGDGPRIIDFGISRAMDATGMTMTGLVVGSPGFMSPEQAEGREVGAPSDVFSLGALLAFSATGEGPFGEGSTPALIYRVVHGAPDTSRLPEQVRPLIERCLSKDPQQRPTSEQILDELGGAQPSADWLPWPVAGATPGGGLPPEIAGLSAARGISMPTPTESAGPRHGGVTPDPATIDSGAGVGAGAAGDSGAPAGSGPGTDSGAPAGSGAGADADAAVGSGAPADTNSGVGAAGAAAAAVAAGGAAVAG
ncbi:MAG: serine/threonine-protein kinase, partial [Streptosporangiaceae bacterium]